MRINGAKYKTGANIFLCTLIDKMNISMTILMTSVFADFLFYICAMYSAYTELP